MATKFPFITDGIHGEVPINFYPAADSERGVILHASPGLSALCTLTDCSEVRGLYAWGNYLYAVAKRGSSSVVWRISASGTAVEIGNIPTSSTGPVWIVNNLTQLLIVDGVTGYTYALATGVFAAITDANFPGALACDYQDTYGLFVKPNSQTWFFSYPNDFRTYNALDTYEKEGRTDNVICILSDGITIYVFGSDSMETWYDAGGNNSSPSNPTFARHQGGVFRYGLGAAKTAQNFDNTPTWISNLGQLVRFSGNVPQIISSDMFGRDIQSMSQFADANAFVYTDNEHTFYQINFPSGDITWVYDAKTKLFHKRSSYRDNDVGYGRHRANCYAMLNNKHYVGDYYNGKIYEMSGDYYSDDGNEIQGVLHSQEIEGGLKRIFFPEVQVFFEQGVGLVSGQGSDPKVVLQYSRDGGKTWSTERQAGLGKIGEYTYRTVWRQNGSDFKRMYRLTITDPVLRRVLGIDFGGQ